MAADKMNFKYELCVVLPIYNNSQTLEKLYDSLHPILGNFQNWVAILVEDGSTDDSKALIKKMDSSPHLIRLFHDENSGQQEALRTGLKSLDAKLYVTMDADFQDDPSDIPEMVEQLTSQNLDAIFSQRENFYQSPFRMFCSRIYKLTVYWMIGLPVNTGAFILFNHETRNKVIDLDTSRFYISGLIAKTTKNISTFSTIRSKRLVGKSEYSFRKRLMAAYSNILCLLE